jgi:hypothetical protein
LLWRIESEPATSLMTPTIHGEIMSKSSYTGP